MMSADGDEDEAVISFDEDDDDDDMAELFSFAAAPSSPEKNNEYVQAMASVMPIKDDSDHSEDSFLEMLEQQNQGISVLNSPKSASIAAANDYDDAETQEILDWLDQDDEKVSEEKEDALRDPPPAPPSPVKQELPKPKDPEPPPPPEFKSLEEAVKSPTSTIHQIRLLLEQEKFSVPANVRPHLWCRVVCHKTLEETLQSSVADSYQQWEQHQGQSTPPDHWIQKQSMVLADRIVLVSNGDRQLCQKALSSILFNHYNAGGQQNQEEAQEDDVIDPLLPPVACAILSAGVPKVAAAVMLNHIIPSFMPILALTMKERAKATEVMHQQFYLLSCYHLPLLVLHLDRYLPLWHLWPPDGLLPQSWLISHLAGECEGTFMNPKNLLSLWDVILTSSNNSLRFFLVMAILDQHSDQLLLLTGDALREEMQKIMAFQELQVEGFAIESEDATTSQQAVRWVQTWTDHAQSLWEATPLSVIRMLKHLEDTTVKEALTKRQEEAEERLRLKLEAEAKAHQEAMEAERERRQDEARLRLTRARLVAYYRTHNAGKETNIDKIMEVYKDRYDVLDAKLKKKYGVGFNPAIKPKPVKSQIATQNTSNILSTMNAGFANRRAPFFGGKRKEDQEFAVPESEKTKSVVVKVAASEVLPIICWSKESNAVRFAKAKRMSKLGHEDGRRMPLKFYLVDSRPETAAEDQGRFPTSASLSPETLLDPDKISRHEEMFESLRGSVHICIMGEGFSALPGLYNHKMTQGMHEHIKEDETRNNLCALFFVKKGFPFVSILDGGFAAAHAWLCREGPKHYLRAHNVLTDYNPDVSLFGRFEKLFQEQQALANATAREKTQRALQNLFDSSMVALTKSTMRFDLSAELDDGENGNRQGQSVVSNLFGSMKEGQNDQANDKPVTSPTLSPSATFLNPFSFKAQHSAEKDLSAALSRQQSDRSLEVESVDFDNPPNESQHEKTESGGESSPILSRPPPNSFAVNKQMHSNDEKVEAKSVDQPNIREQAPKVNPFAGFGAVLNNSILSASSNGGDSGAQSAGVLARNPFARFGMGTKGDSKGVGVTVPFGSFNQLRKTTMARMMTGGSDGAEDIGFSNNDATEGEARPSPTIRRV